MSAHTIPTSIQTVHVVAQLLQDLIVTNPLQASHQASLHRWLGEEVPFFESSISSADPAVLRALHTVSLACLSMLGGIFVPVVNQFQVTGRHYEVTWETGSKDAFDYGVWDDSSKNWCHSLFQRMAPGSFYALHPKEVWSLCGQQIHSYITLLEICSQFINQLTESEQGLVHIVEKPFQRELLFILISCLPVDQMNALFVYVQQFFPDDLSVKTDSGNQVNVTALFDKASSDPQFLIEKTKVYLDLYFTNTLPIIKEITQSKTSAFLVSMIQNKQVLRETMDTLKSLKLNQMDSRTTCYQTLLTWMEHVSPQK